MLDREVIKEFLVAQFEDEDGDAIPEDIDLDKLAEDFSIYIENDYYEWLKDNFKSYLFQTEFSWEKIKDKLQNNPTKPW